MAERAECVWNLIDVADWVSSVLATMMREIIMERGRYEWCDPDEPEGGKLFPLDEGQESVLKSQPHLFECCIYSTPRSAR